MSGINDLPGFYPTIKDGGLGALPSLNVSVFGVYGVSEKGVKTPKMVSDINTIQEEYGMGTLTEQLIDAFVCGARQVVALRADASTVHVVGTPVLTGTGTATAEAVLQTGVLAVKADRTHLFKITVGGTAATAKYQYSKNGGITYGEEQSFGASPAEITLEDGTKITFTDAEVEPEGSFVLGDIWTLENTEAKMDTTDRAAALDTICAYKDANGIGLPLVYDTSEGDEVIWAVLGSKADEVWTNEQRPIWFLINATKPDYADIDAWLTALIVSSAAYRHERVGVNAFYGRLVDTRGNILIQAGGGSVAGFIAKGKLHWSIAWVREFVFPNCIGIEPYNSDIDKMDLGRIAQLNDAKFISARQWAGYGNAPVDDWLMAPATSDFSSIRNRRIMDAAIVGVQMANTPFTNSPGVAKEDMIAYKKALESPLDSLITEGAIMSFTLTLTPDDNIWTNGIVYATIEIIPTATKKKLSATFQLKSGTAASA